MAPDSIRSTGRSSVRHRASLKSKYSSSVAGVFRLENSTRKSASLVFGSKSVPLAAEPKTSSRTTSYWRHISAISSCLSAIAACMTILPAVRETASSSRVHRNSASNSASYCTRASDPSQTALVKRHNHSTTGTTGTTVIRRLTVDNRYSKSGGVCRVDNREGKHQTCVTISNLPRHSSVLIIRSHLTP